MTVKTQKTAQLSTFKLLNSHILQGEELCEIKRLARSIKRFGILNPIITTRLQDSLIVVDGKKRLQALRRLEFSGHLSEDMKNIPFLSVLESRELTRQSTTLLSGEAIYKVVTRLRSRGASTDAIAEHLSLCRHTISDVLVLSRLSATVRQAYFDRAITFTQARAYAMLPSEFAQTALFMKLGINADETRISRVIKSIILRSKSRSAASSTEKSLKALAKSVAAHTNSTFPAAA